VAASDLLTEMVRLPVPDAAVAWDDEIERRGAEVEAGIADTISLGEYRAHVQLRRAAGAQR
jgi:hypothetical protein